MRCQDIASTTSVSLVALMFGAGVLWAGEPIQPGGLSDAQNKPVSVQRGSRLDLYGDPLPDGAIARMGTTRFQSDDYLSPVFALSHDGALFAAGAPADKVRVCERLSGRVLLTVNMGKRLRELDEAGGVLGFSRDGRFLLVCTVADTLELWQISNGKRLWQKPLKGGSVFRAVFTNDDKEIRFWETWGRVLVVLATTSGKEIGRYKLREPARAFEQLVVPNDGPVTVVPVPGHLRIWNVVSGTQVGHIKFDFGRFFFLSPFALSRSGRLAAFAKNGSKSFLLRDLASGKERIFQVPFDKRFSLDFSPDDNTLACATTEIFESGPCVFLYEPSSGKLLGCMNADLSEERELSGRARNSFGGASPTIAFSPDSRLLAWRDDRSVCLWDIARGKQIRRWLVGQAARDACLEFSGDGRILAVQEGKSVRFFDVATGADSPPRSGHSDEVTQLVFSDDGKLLASGGLDRIIGVWETATGRPVQRLNDTTSARGALAFTPDGLGLACFDGDHDETLRVWDLGTGKEMLCFQDETALQRATFHRPARDSYLGFLNNGRILAAGVSYSEPVRYFDMASGKEQSAVKNGASDDVLGLAASPDGRNLAISIGQERIDLIDAVTMKTRRSIPMKRERYAFCRAPFFSPDGRVVGRTFCYTTRFFEAATGKPILTITPPQNFGILAATVTPDGTILLIEEASSPSGIYLRDGFSGRRIYRFPIELSAWFSGTVAAFSRDARRLALAYNDTEIAVWPLDSLLKDVAAAERLDTSRLDELWATLATDDAGRAYRAVLSLSHSPKQSVPFMNARLRATPPPDRNKLRVLVHDLDDADYKVRARAHRLLEEVAEESRGFFKETLAGQCSAETRQHLERLLEGGEQRKPTPESVRHWRAVMALEQAGTAEAKQVLRRLAAGAPEHWLTTEAVTSLKRLERREANTR